MDIQDLPDRACALGLPRFRQRILGAPIAIVFALALNAFSQTNPTKHWVGTWSAAPYLVGSANEAPSPGLANNTLRQVVRVSIGGDTLRLKLTNIYNAQSVTVNSVNIAVSTGSGGIDASTLKNLSFGGAAKTTMAAGASVTSDALAFNLKPSMQVAISICYGSVSSAMTGHVGSRTLSYIVAGDRTTAATLSGAATTPHWYSINTLDVWAPKSTAAVAVLGNSITDGYGLANDLQNRWTDAFSIALLANAPTANVGVLNMGIGGSNVLGTCQTCGQARFQNDVLDQSGMGWLIVFYGINDICSSNASSASLIAGYTALAKLAKAAGAKVYGATITPVNGNTYYSTAHEQVRSAVNNWIRGGGGGNYDGVIDFDKAIRDPSDSTKMQSALKNDWLHPNADGYKFLGQHVPLNLFAGTDALFGGEVAQETGFALKSSYPSPLGSSMTIPFEIPKDGFVSLKVFSTDGKEVAELAGKNFSSGDHSVELATSNLPDGVYFYAIKADGFSASRKMYLQGR
jgi:lysophospholipase L1-like esterase